MAPSAYYPIEVRRHALRWPAERPLTFSQVDPETRGFVAQLTHGKIAWTSPGQPEVDCEIDATPLWATAGNFI
ncbi:MAG: hypothetical protein IPI67_30075 [Myxococcales bacterium]|nr:hypothetical protein [Myxococcales bacterium]